MSEIGRWSEAARGYVVFGVLSIVAVAQLARVDAEGLTRWKGGGFGMYSDFHVMHREVWVEVASSDDLTPVRVPREIKRAANRCAQFANALCLRDLQGEVQRVLPNARALHVWTFDVDAVGERFGRTMIAQWWFSPARTDGGTR